MMTLQESRNEGNNAAICRQSVSNSTHAMLPNAVTNIRASIGTEASAGWLEINRTLDLGQVTSGKICRSA